MGVPDGRGDRVITVSIVEDDGGVRKSLARVVDRADGLRCVSQHGSAEEALDQLPPVRPQVVLMDVKLPGASGIECVQQLKPLLPETQIIMLTVYQDDQMIFNALAAGATGYLLKRARPSQLIEAIRDVNSGGSPMSSHIARKVVEVFRDTPGPPPNGEALTPREYQVLELLSKGFLYKEIAGVLGVSYETVHSHVRKVYEKLHVKTRTQAVALHLTRSLSAAGRRPGRSL
jgi:DNA-binding NarL/FixJ family response regulator